MQCQLAAGVRLKSGLPCLTLVSVVFVGLTHLNALVQWDSLAANDHLEIGPWLCLLGISVDIDS